MVYHRNQAQFERAKWQKRFLLPAWGVQYGLLLALTGIFSYRISETIQNYEDNDKKGKLPLVEMIWECTNIAMALLSLLLTTMEVAKTVSETLTPFFMLFTNTVKLTCASAILVLDVIEYLNRKADLWSTTGMAIDIALIVCTLVPAIYAIVTFRRLSHYDEYHHPVNVKAYGFFSNEQVVELGRSPDLRSSVGSGLGGDYLSTEYRPEQSRSRSASAASTIPTLMSLRRKSTSSTTAPTVTIEHIGRRESYDHKRDTQFDEYLSRSRRASFNAREDVDRAIAAEFGWSSGDYDGAERTENPLGVADSGPTAANGRPSVRDSGGRTRSWASEHGLVAVPEEEFDDNNPLLNHNRRPSSEEDIRRAVSPPMPDMGIDNRKMRRVV